MHSLTTLARLYRACGFRVKPVMAHRLLGAPAITLAETVTALQDVSAEKFSHDDVQYERKMWRAKRIAYLIASLPFVRGVAVCNSLAFQMVHEESDVDLFIITAHNRVWSARWWVTGVLALLRMRPGEAVRDPVCVSFFVDECVNDVSHLMIEKDVYFYYWLRSLMPLSGNHSLFAGGAHTAPEFRVAARWPGYIQKFLEIFARLLSETYVHHQQEHIMPDDLKHKADDHDTTVVLSDTIVKLHQNDRRVELRDLVMMQE